MKEQNFQIGDKVKLISGNHFDTETNKRISLGTIGIIISLPPGQMKEPVNIVKGNEIDTAPSLKAYDIKTEDGRRCTPFEDQLEKID
jgi:hypothetical protein